MIALFGLFSIGLLVFGAFVIALATKRNGIAATLGALLLAGFGLSALFVLFGAGEVYTPPEISVPLSVPSAPSAPRMEISGPQIDHASYGRISFFGLLLAVAFLGFVVAGVLKATKKCDGGSYNWSALLLIPLAFFLVMGGVRVTKTTHVNANPAPPIVNTFPAPPAPQVAQADVHAEIQHGDIHMLMDKADAPRIDLKAEAAGGVAVMSVAETQKSEPANDATADAKKDVTTESADAKSAAAEDDSDRVAESKDADEDHKEVEAISVAAKSSDTDAKSDGLADDKREGPKPNPAPNSADAAQNSTAAASHSEEVDFAEEPKPSAPRPDWVAQTSARVGDAWQEVIVTDEYATEAECRRATDICLMFKTYERFQTLAGRPFVDTSLPSITFNKGQVLADGHIIYDDGNPEYWSDWRLNELLKMGIGIDYIRREIVDKQYTEQSERSFGPMYKMYTLVRFTPSVDAELRRHWAYMQRQDQFGMVGVGAASVLGLLGLIYGLLKVDTLTKGYYTKRLFIGVPAAIIGGTVLFSLLVEILS